MKNNGLGVETTFTPLKRNRLRCNQTGQVIKKSKADTLRRSRFASGRNNFRLAD